MACGLDHTLAVAQNGQVYAFGDNSLCQLGRGGSMGVQAPSADPDAWIIRDEDGHSTAFTKVGAHLQHICQLRCSCLAGNAQRCWHEFDRMGSASHTFTLAAMHDNSSSSSSTNVCLDLQLVKESLWSVAMRWHFI